MGIKLFLDQIWQNVKVGLNDVNDSFGNRPPPGGEKLTNFLQKLVLPNGTLVFLINFRVMLQAVHSKCDLIAVSIVPKWKRA